MLLCHTFSTNHQFLHLAIGCFESRNQINHMMSNIYFVTNATLNSRLKDHQFTAENCRSHMLHVAMLRDALQGLFLVLRISPGPAVSVKA